MLKLTKCKFDQILGSTSTIQSNVYFAFSVLWSFLFIFLVLWFFIYLVLWIRSTRPACDNQAQAMYFFHKRAISASTLSMLQISMRPFFVQLVLCLAIRSH